ncbi:response regulator transcription factor [Streptomyces sp. NBC_01485]|uniref:helix-turn-helix transcriptional regulator n=1 Tax=Streptomyces sp. NBC_01485 TaxID=2903884 RepID=UPI002E37FDE3|nr:response regulator transcription factor [Streptomyces sp. NBC_01485]
MRRRPEVRVLAPALLARADVVVVMVTDVTEDTLSWMERAAKGSTNPGMRIVLVANTVSDLQLMRGVHFGLFGVLLRPYADYARILQAVQGCRAGQAALPQEHVASLIEQVRTAQHNTPGIRGMFSFGFEQRDLDILKMIAEGLETTEIAQKLNYSERTIKNALHAMLSRLGLRNRAHAVAYALRAGLL